VRPEKTIKLVIGFDGTRYEGWQSQLNGKTIQEVFEKILKKIFSEPTPITGSSRTDSGVHALGMAAHFKTKSPLGDREIKKALNFYLPKDILVHSALTVSPGFHARFHAKSKLYRYDIWNSATRPLFEAPYVLWYPYRLNARLMARAARHLKGKHDFRAFCNNEEEKDNCIRVIKRITVTKDRQLIRVSLEANGFLKHMVRIIVGTLIEVGRGKIKPDAVRDILHSKDRKKAGPTARPYGLTLVKVAYAGTVSS
jgi:tRNA pseudouridine38-40 synthase